jgi:hypothetical protein
MIKKHLLCFLAVALSVFLSSCDPEDNKAFEMDREAFETERAAWDNQNLKDYQFTYQYLGGSLGPFGPFTITVRENEESVVEWEGRHADGLVFRNIAELYGYINGAFEIVDNIKNGTHEGPEIRSMKLDITYNTQYHYPTEANLSTGYAENIVGGMLDYTLLITDFTPLN